MAQILKVCTAAGVGLVAVLLMIGVLWTLSALFWGWLFMLVMGAVGHPEPYLPVSVGVGYVLSLVLG